MFLKTFMLKLREANTEKSKLKTLFQAISGRTTKRGAGATLLLFVFTPAIQTEAKTISQREINNCITV